MTDEPALLTVALATGTTLGAAYLGALWVTIWRLSRSDRAVFLLLSSTVARIGLLLTAWYWIAGGQWDRLLACLAGFLLARFVAMRLAATSGLKREMTP